MGKGILFPPVCVGIRLGTKRGNGRQGKLEVVRYETPQPSAEAAGGRAYVLVSPEHLQMIITGLRVRPSDRGQPKIGDVWVDYSFLRDIIQARLSWDLRGRCDNGIGVLDAVESFRQDEKSRSAGLSAILTERLGKFGLGQLTRSNEVWNGVRLAEPSLTVQFVSSRYDVMKVLCI
jgi:hypothetical protein